MESLFFLRIWGDFRKFYYYYFIIIVIVSPMLTKNKNSKDPIHIFTKIKQGFPPAEKKQSKENKNSF